VQNLAKVGDMIIDSDQINVITKIDNGLVFFSPLIKDVNVGKGEVICSIPTDNFSKAGIRFLLTKDEVKAFLKDLTTQKPLNIPVYTNKNNNSLKEYLYLNNPTKTGQLLIFLNHRQKDIPLSKFDQIIFDQAICHLAEEIAAVNETNLEVAKKQILASLAKNTQPDTLPAKA